LFSGKGVGTTAESDRETQIVREEMAIISVQEREVDENTARMQKMIKELTADPENEQYPLYFCSTFPERAFLPTNYFLFIFFNSQYYYFDFP